MAPTYLTFQQFNDPGLATAIAEKLKEEGIDCRMESDESHFSAILGHNTPGYISLQLPGTDFTRAHAILEAYYQAQLQDVEPDYYLYSFTDEELMEIVSKPDEWGHFDYVLARKLLAERGKPVTDEIADQLKQRRLEELAQPDSRPAGDAGPIPPLGGAGAIMGYIMATHKKTLPNGEQVYSYPQADRKRGKTIFYIAIVVLILFLLERLLTRQ